MIRGTNKRIIEINGEDGSCFERIVLFLRPEQDEESERSVLKLAEDYADGIFKAQAPVSMLSRPRRRFTASLRQIGIAALLLLAAGSAVALCVVLL